MKEFKCEKCGSTDITINIVVNPNGLGVISVFCSAYSDVTEGWCNECKEKCTVVSEESSPLYYCDKCGATNLQRKAWVNLNEGNQVFDYCSSEKEWCESCHTHVTSVFKRELVKNLDDWFRRS